MAGAAYDCAASCTNDETFVLTLELMKSNGDPFEVDDYAFEYSVKGCGLSLLLTEEDGIAKDSINATLTISPGVDFRFRPGLYNHGLRKRDLVSGRVDQIFDGTLTVAAGNF